MNIIDISRRISREMATYPLNPVYQREVIRDVPEAPSSLSRITLGTHTGTHVDAPRHVLRDGEGVDRVPIDRLIGPAIVVGLTRVAEVIRSEHLLNAAIRRDDIVLLKTRNSAADPTIFDETFIACDESAAEHLVAQSIRAVGIDGPSIKKYKVRDRTHHIFLERGIPIVEGLDLARVELGRYTLVCLPLALSGADGAPARAVLLPETLSMGGAHGRPSGNLSGPADEQFHRHSAELGSGSFR